MQDGRENTRTIKLRLQKWYNRFFFGCFYTIFVELAQYYIDGSMKLYTDMHARWRWAESRNPHLYGMRAWMWLFRCMRVMCVWRARFRIVVLMKFHVKKVKVSIEFTSLGVARCVSTYTLVKIPLYTHIAKREDKDMEMPVQIRCGEFSPSAG